MAVATTRAGRAGVRQWAGLTACRWSHTQLVRHISIAIQPTYSTTRLYAPHPAGKPLLQLVVKPETALVRPYVVAAVLRGVTFDATRYNSFIDLQARVGCQRKPANQLCAALRDFLPLPPLPLLVGLTAFASFGCTVLLLRHCP